MANGLRLLRTPHSSLIHVAMSMFAPDDNPTHVRIHGVWPRFRILFEYEWVPSAKKLTEKGGKIWTASAPPAALCLPDSIDADDNADCVITQISNTEYTMDFDPQPSETIEDMIVAGGTLLLEFNALAKRFALLHGGSLADELNVTVMTGRPAPVKPVRRKKKTTKAKKLRSTAAKAAGKAPGKAVEDSRSQPGDFQIPDRFLSAPTTVDRAADDATITIRLKEFEL